MTIIDAVTGRIECTLPLLTYQVLKTIQPLYLSKLNSV